MNSRVLTKQFDMFEFRCRVCGKVVCTPNPDMWVYKVRCGKNRKHYCCSWSCLQKMPAQGKGGEVDGQGKGYQRA